MSGKFAQELGEYVRKEAIYNNYHIDRKGPLERYLAHLDTLVFDPTTTMFTGNYYI